MWCNLRMLKAYLRGLGSDEARAAFAVACGTSLPHLRNVIYCGKPLAPITCVQVEQRSDRRVMRWHLRPLDWHLIWPELMALPDAPIVRHQTVITDCARPIAAEGEAEAARSEGLEHGARSMSPPARNAQAPHATGC